MGVERVDETIRLIDKALEELGVDTDANPSSDPPQQVAGDRPTVPANLSKAVFGNNSWLHKAS